MLKVYNVTSYVSIDGASWRLINHRCVASDTELETQLVLDNLSFEETRDYLSQNSLRGVWNDSTFFGKKPTIEVNYYSACEPVAYKKFHTLSYKTVVDEWKNVSLNWIMENLSADECIQYIKDRGMTACPILK